MKVYHLIGNFIAADRDNNYLIPSYSDHLLLGFFNVSNSIFEFNFFYNMLDTFYHYYLYLYLLILF